MFKDRVLFIDGEAIILDKPAGLPVDRPRDGSESLEDMLDQLTFGFQRLPLPVHRLDRDTSGCLLLARNPKAHKRFQQAFEAGAVTKRYVAILDGIPEEQTGLIDLSLAKTSTAEAGWRMRGDPTGKAARTRWKVIDTGTGRNEGRALVAFYPETGRTHQIRVHMAAQRHPCVGDAMYGADPTISARLGLTRQWLHAKRLGFIHPRTREYVSFESPYPLDLQNALDILRRD
jgi:tRNA pseudouridine32 synthase/23S rRNA pseudouridine746 synthase